MVFCVSCATWIHCFRSAQSVNNVENVSAWRSWHRTAYVVYVQWILSKMAPGWHGGDKLLNKVIFIFFAHKKYSRSFVKLRLNPWCQMDYFNDVFSTFLDLDRGNFIAVYGRVRELSEFIKNILICVLKMNGGLTGLEKHWGWVINDSIFIFGWTIPLNCGLYIAILLIMDNVPFYFVKFQRSFTNLIVPLHLKTGQII